MSRKGREKKNTLFLCVRCSLKEKVNELGEKKMA